MAGKREPPKRQRRHHDEPDWDAVHAGYLAGRKPQDLARDFGTTANAVSTRASKLGWRKDRQEIARSVADELPGVVASAILGEVERRTALQLEDADALRVLLRLTMAAVTTAGDVAASVKSARGIADLERLALGIVAPGKDGGVNGGANVGGPLPALDDLRSMGAGELDRRIGDALGRARGGES